MCVEAQGRAGPVVCLHRAVPSVFPASALSPWLPFPWKLSSVCSLPWPHSHKRISLLACLALGHQDFYLISPDAQGAQPMGVMAPFPSLWKRSSPLCAR